MRMALQLIKESDVINKASASDIFLLSDGQERIPIKMEMVMML